MKILKWTPDFTADHEPPVAPVWISFNHLPIHLFQKGPLMSLASLLGRPLRIDAATRTLSRPSVARVCVEVNLLRHLPNRIWIGHGDSGFWQSVTYDNLPHYCTSCSRLGHLDGECTTVVPQIPQTQVWKPKSKPLPSEQNHPNTSGLTLSEKAQIPEAIPASTKPNPSVLHPFEEAEQSVPTTVAMVQPPPPPVPSATADVQPLPPLIAPVDGQEDSLLPPVIVPCA